MPFASSSPVKRRIAPRPLVDMVPLIDVVFQLILFFLVSSSLVTRSGLVIELPSAREGEIFPAAPLTLELGAQGTVSLDGQVIEEATLERELHAAARAYRQAPGEDLRLSLRADAALSYGRVLYIMDLSRRAGFSHIDLETSYPLDLEASP